MDDSKLEKIYKFCKLLRFDDIRKEIDEQIQGYSLNSIKKYSTGWLCSLTGISNKYIELLIGRDEISLMKQSNNAIEKITVDELLSLSHKTIEKCSNGVICSIVEKQYFPLKNLKNGLVLHFLGENRYALTKKNLEGLFINFDFERSSWLNWFLQFSIGDGRLKRLCDSYSSFTAVDFKDDCNAYPASVCLNGENVSDIFYAVNGPGKVHKIYDLYRGIIDSRNEEDIDLINLGFLSQDAYDLKDLKGITEKEDSIVGKPLDGVCVSSEYINYLKQLFGKYGYSGDLQLDRDSILTAITCQKPNTELISEQEEYTKPQIDIQTNEVVKNKPRRLLRGLFGKK